uniref:t-SNARE domain-containing protein 1 n=1 Tax=Magallana gigas TaxID=29159 RepID=K1PZN2_MAGGI|eukprot:XP_019930159.1 PREDICTED: t-SNARE domain-containing protein 1 [Crassostrea gigas]
MARKPNYTKIEIETLIEKVQNNKDILNSAFSNIATNSSKQRIWTSIASKVSAVSGVERSAEDVKKKWRNISSDTKKKLSTARKEARKTGGGVSAGEELNPIQHKIAETMGRTAIQGIPGGYDSADCTSTITQPVEHVHGEDR